MGDNHSFHYKSHIFYTERFKCLFRTITGHTERFVSKLCTFANKSQYTDWTNRQDIRVELYADVAKKLYAQGFPPEPIDDVYAEIMKQVENLKK